MTLSNPSFLFVDSIQEMTKGKFIRGIKAVTEDDFFLYPRSCGIPYFPPALVGETLGQLAAWNVMHTNGFKTRPVAGIVSQASLKKPVKVGEILELEAHIDNLDEQAVTYHGVAKVANEVVFALEGALGPLLPMEDFISVDVVKAQFASLINATIPPREKAMRTCHTEQPWFHFDTIHAHQSGESLIASKYIDPSSPFFADHFPNNPVWPLTVLLECVINLATCHLLPKEVKTRPVTLQKIKMKDFVKPGSSVTTTLTTKSQSNGITVLQSITESNGRRVCVFELVY